MEFVVKVGIIFSLSVFMILFSCTVIIILWLKCEDNNWSHVPMNVALILSCIIMTAFIFLSVKLHENHYFIQMEYRNLMKRIDDDKKELQIFLIKHPEFNEITENN